ncbi:peptide ABC transporter permease [Corynebacterium lactis RW2-5]|uniref:Peptide ABC transporter permease n=2 Tax=Corynebacterium lactis TaxID=1231000 RepID=A0A0K2GYC6_9CORY|nr:ABC transporter permease [Corynebacterium lactis]ALA66481.1 peptide ABC transporter permease [Corynebacterium lactis RW2-5]
MSNNSATAMPPSRMTRRHRRVRFIHNRDNLAGLPRMIAMRLVAIAVLTIFVSFVMFALAAISPFNPLAHYIGTDFSALSPAEREALTASLGMDRPFYVQWLDWFGGLLSGDLGYSRTYSRPVSDVLAQRLPWTILLSLSGIALTVVLAIVLGVLAGRRPGSLLDRFCIGLSVFLGATPSFVYALAVLMVFAVIMQVIPSGGAAPIGMDPSFTTIGPFLIGPAIVLAITQLPWPLLAVRQATAEAQSSAAVAAAFERGVPSRIVVGKHIVPMSLMPVVTLVGGRLSELVVGAVIVEAVFSWPGIAEATVEAAKAVDFPLLAITTVLTTLLVMGGSLIADITYTLLDPRVSDV